MKYTEDQILSDVRYTEGLLGSRRDRAQKSEDAWALRLWKKSAAKTLEEDNHEQVTLSTPRNIISVAERLVSTEPDIE